SITLQRKRSTHARRAMPVSRPVRCSSIRLNPSSSFGVTRSLRNQKDLPNGCRCSTPSRAVAPSGKYPMPAAHGRHKSTKPDPNMEQIEIPTMAQLAAAGRKPEYLFWVGCSGSYDPRSQKISVALVKLLHAAGVDFAILGDEEACTGDPARRAGNEFLFQMLAHQNIATLDGYGVTRIVASCPHC